DRVSAEQVMALAADVRNLRHKIVRNLLLNDDVPVLVVEILAMAIDRFGTVELILGIEERDQGIGQRGKIRRGKRIARDGAFGGIGEIVVVVAAIINAEAAADGSLAVEHRGCPGYADPRAEVVRVGFVVGCAFGAEAAAGLNVDYGGTVENLVR